MGNYQSRYSPGKNVSGFHLILEVVCENKAKKDKKDLPTFFWRLPEWEKFYKQQLRACSKLCKNHGESKVLAFIKEKNIFSLNAKWIDEALSEYSFKENIPEAPPVENIGDGKSIGVSKKIRGFDRL